MSSETALWSEIRRDVARVGARRMIVTAILVIAAVLVARLSWHLPLTVDAERALFDVRAWALAPHVAQDPRIVLITYTDETLEATGRRSPLDRGMLARALKTLDAMKPKSIGIDILIDQPQPEDAQLQAALRAMRTPTYLAFASATTNEDSVVAWQEAFERQFLASLTPGNVHPASVRLEADQDGVMRSWPTRQKGDQAILVDRMAAVGTASGAKADPFRDYNRSIAFRLPELADQTVFESIPIDSFGGDLPPEIVAGMLASHVAGRHVFIGGDIKDVDRFDMPATRLFPRQTITGLEVHATMLAQRLDGLAAYRLPSFALWMLSLIVVLIAAATGARDFGRWGIALLIVELAGIAAAPFGFEAAGLDTQFLPAFGWLAGWVLAYSATVAAARSVGSEQRAFAQSALGRYLPPEIANEIMRDPGQLKLTGERRTIYALFSDIEGFTSLTHAIEPEVTAAVLNRYLDEMSDIVLRHGGTIDKFVGDAVVAFWGAPIARDSDGENALKTAIAMAEAGDRFSRETTETIGKLGRTRVGVHRGEAIVGNFGGDDRIQYTALGDVMNTAARLEGANKSMHTRSLVSAEAAEGVAGLLLRPMGRVTVRGRSTPIVVYEPYREATQPDIDALTALIAAYDAGAPDALAALETHAASHPSDAALANLVYRLKDVGPGGCYALG